MSMSPSPLPNQSDCSDEDFNTIAAANGRQVEVPEAFICPITMSLMLHPLVNRAGHTFESEAILGWLKKNGQCPLTRQPMSPSNFIRDRRLELKIKAFRHQHGIPEPSWEHGHVNPTKLASGFIMTVTKDEDEKEAEVESSTSSSRRPSSLLSMIGRKVRKDYQTGRRQLGNQ